MPMPGWRDLRKTNHAPWSSALALSGWMALPAWAATDSAGDAVATPDSTEQGQTQIAGSFDNRPLQSLLHESKLVGLRDTTFNVQLRSFDLDRQNFNDTTSRAWALGGSLGVKTGYFGSFVAVGATGYTSQRLDAPAGTDGAQLLQTGQKQYTVLGELYAQFRLTDSISGTAGRRVLDTPYINTHDSLMTPNTFTQYALQGVVGGEAGAPKLAFGAGYVDTIKERNSEQFVSMAKAAGAPAGVDRGVSVAGAVFTDGQFTLGALNYYSADIIDIGYVEIKYAVPVADRITVRLGSQYSDQHSVGDDLLNGKAFSTSQYGGKAELAVGAALFTVARTLNATGTLSKGDGTNLISPWGSYPGVTSAQIKSFMRAGENATLMRAAYNFPRQTGLTAYVLWVHGSTPDVARQYAQSEADVSLQWTAQNATLKGLKLLARYGHVSQGGSSDQHENELRLAAYYVLR